MMMRRKYGLGENMKTSKEENDLVKKQHYIHGLGRMWVDRLFNLGRRGLDGE